LFSVDVLLKAAGDAPIMKKKKWAVDANKTVAYLVEFIRKYIKCTPSDSLVRF
jgi:ubiquitin-like protein ATG12